LTALARSTAKAGAWRQALRCALAAIALASTGPARAQFAGSLDVESVNRYRGTGTPDAGAVVRASAMADAAIGAYGGIAGLWRTRDAGLASADAILGWSGRLASLPGLAAMAPDWGWDAAVHRTHYGSDSSRDFSELMLGVLAPDVALRTWYSPHYFGGYSHTFYTELNASHAFDDRWHAFGHVGWLRYGPAESYQSRTPDRTDTLLGIGATLSSWDVHLARDGILAGQAPSEMDARRRRPAWILGASVAF
jgi:hypothetical protein